MSEPALRVDARRNVERILSGAMEVLSEDPAASMEQIAAASDVHRTTIYRRFPTREALIDGLIERGFEEGADLISSVSRVAPSEAVLRDLCAEMIAIGARYAFVLTYYRMSELGRAAAGTVELFTRYQRAGVLRDDLPALWLAHLFTTLIIASVEAHRYMDVDEEAAADLLARTFLEGALKPRSNQR